MIRSRKSTFNSSYYQGQGHPTHQLKNSHNDDPTLNIKFGQTCGCVLSSRVMTVMIAEQANVIDSDKKTWPGGEWQQSCPYCLKPPWSLRRHIEWQQGMSFQRHMKQSCYSGS
eukprot:scaffold135859_cov63-Attheya_sp.AAC.4